jgi:RNA polymerase sigma factor (sigma-70 family)
MDDALSIERTAEQDRRIFEAVERERSRLRSFIRRRVADEGDVEDILQDVFSELVEAYRLTRPVEQVGAWLFRVTRNRITDLFRRRRPEALGHDRPRPTRTENSWAGKTFCHRRTRAPRRPMPGSS